MFIVTSKKFIAGPGADSLAGQMAEKAGEDAWLDQEDVEGANFWLGD